MANVKISNAPPIGLPTGSALTGAELVPMDQTVSGITTTIKATTAAIAALGGGGSTVQFIESAGWNSSSGGILLSQTVAQDIQIPYGCVLQNVRIQTQGPTGNCTVTLTQSAFPFVTGTDITGGVSPQITIATSYNNSVLSGWVTSFAQGVMIRATLTAVTNFTSVKIMLRFK